MSNRFVVNIGKLYKNTNDSLIVFNFKYGKYMPLENNEIFMSVKNTTYGTMIILCKYGFCEMLTCVCDEDIQIIGF